MMQEEREKLKEELFHFYKEFRENIEDPWCAGLNYEITSFYGML